ncbi:MAG: HAMP domain-containing sensor histidine kinase [Candidatus Margulisiibacteriota bacterium]
MSEAEMPDAGQSEKINKIESENKRLREEIKRTEQERVEYLQNVSHQLVAPLNAIKWHIENLTEGRIGYERGVKVLRSIYSQASIAVHLAKNFSLMSNLEGEHALSSLKEPLEEVNLHRLLINLSNDFQPLAWDQKIDIKVEDDQFDDAPCVLAMKPLISQVFSNVIENAVKYSNQGSKIIIHGRYVLSSDTFLVSIKNQGIPLPIEHEQEVFNRGFRTADAQRKAPAGTGFGLYIARRIIESHEGKISALTENGWTVFNIVLSVKGLKGKARIRDA